MQKDQRRPESSFPDVGEIVAAGLLGFIGFLVAFRIVRDGGDISQSWRIILIATASSGFLVWVGGSGLTRLCTWIVAGKMVGAVMFMLGMTTVITGYHTEGHAKIWTRVDRDADIDLIGLGLALLALSFLVDAFLKRRKT